MAENEKRTFDIPWATWLPLIAALAGVIAQLRPLTSARPAAPGEKAIEVRAVQDVDARLWQDPLAVAQKAKAQLDAEMLVKSVPAERTIRHQLDTLVGQVRKQAEGSPILLLAVMIDSGPYPEQGESRLRARQAVLTGMNESGWLPVDSEHIGYVTVPSQPGTEMSFLKTTEDTAMLVPWEECKVGTRDPTVYPVGAEHAYVLWLPSSSFNPKPLDSFARLVAPFIDPKGNVQIRLIGPANSTGLQCMLEEKKTWEQWFQSPPVIPLAPITREDVLDRVCIISPLATAADEELLGANPTEPSVAAAIEHSIFPRTGLRFTRTIAADDVVMRALIQELTLHDVDVVPKLKSRIQKFREWFQSLLPGNSKAALDAKSSDWVDGDRIVILSEWDSAYGRSLTSTFEREVAKRAGSSGDEGKARTRIDSYTYMHGIDGRLPGDPAGTTAKDQSQNSAADRAVAIEMTEGVDQSDFLRRLARLLKDQDTSLKHTGDRGIRAVGLLGSDIFDKLMILRALRRELPEALFFTNNYDAHFERRDDWVDVRNLIVASPFGPVLKVAQASDRPPFKQKVAPFRDNNQTALFAGTLVATGRLGEDDIQKQIESQPRLYEIGRRGANEFLDTAPADDSGVHRLLNEVCTGPRIALLLGAGAALFLMGLWFSRGVVTRPEKGDRGVVFRVLRALSHTTPWIIFTVLFIGIAVSWFAQTHPADQEPLAFHSGISIWPSEMLRLIAFFLAIHFLIKAHVNLLRNEDAVNQHFHLVSPHLGFWDSLRLKNLRLGLRRWKEHLAWADPDARVPAEKAWIAYLRRNQFWPRVIRVVALCALYLVFAICAFVALFPMPVVPARGEVAFNLDWCVLIPTIVALIVLTFYVVDAIQLNSNFIRIFTYGLTEWKPGISPGSNRVPPLSETEISRYHDIVFVAQRTEVVARLIWYPLIVLTLMVLARSSLFDNWSWPPGLIMIFGLNAMWAIGSAVYLRRTAEQLRGTAIENLERFRVANYKEYYKRRTFEELISDIRTLKKGAFAPLSDQPFVRAILVPSGGFGLLAVAQRLLDVF
jgi:hypothetical protein